MNQIINFGKLAIRADRIEAISATDESIKGTAIFCIGNSDENDCYQVSDDFESVLIKWHAALSTTQPKEEDESR